MTDVSMKRERGSGKGRGMKVRRAELKELIEKEMFFDMDDYLATV